jgi:hypothetical protein
LKNYTVRTYNPDDFALWNDFINRAKNATFLFHRNFMEYHSDRFEDFSLLIFDDNKLVSVLPANRVEDTIYSHQGLTYGGFVFDEKIDEESIFLSLISFFKSRGIKKFVLKRIVSIYDNYSYCSTTKFLDRQDIQTTLVQKMNLAINLKSNFEISKSKLKHFKKIKSVGLEIRKENNFCAFWNDVLNPKLEKKYNTKPVHSLDEITHLSKLFPKNIIQYNVYFENTLIAGITIFKTKNVVKSQYGATTELGKKYRALDYLYIRLIDKYKENYNYFDMGTVDDDSEIGYNVGLFNQKKELGCNLYYQNFYQYKL